MRILIVAKTRMTRCLCVGGLGIDEGEKLRLLDENGHNQPPDTPFDVGEVWEITGRPRASCTPPHTEDFLVTNRHLLWRELHLERFLSRRVEAWEGGPEQLFAGALRFTVNRAGYISRRVEVPRFSTGFWRPDQPLLLDYESERPAYLYTRGHFNCRIRYVGLGPVEELLPVGTLIRVSLARWWRQDDAPDLEERCYLQLSGWFRPNEGFTASEGAGSLPRGAAFEEAPSRLTRRPRT
jgi:ATP-dependent DNA helicase RecQ